MRKVIPVLLLLAAASVSVMAATPFGGGGAPEIDANTAATAMALLAGWAAVIRGRWNKKRTPEPQDAGTGDENSAE